MKRLTQFIEEPGAADGSPGKLSSTRLMFLLFGLAALISWFAGRPFGADVRSAVEYLPGFGALGGIRLFQRYGEKTQ